MAEPGGEPAGESLEVPGDLARHLVGPYAPHRQIEVPLRSRDQAVVGLDQAPIKIGYLS